MCIQKSSTWPQVSATCCRIWNVSFQWARLVKHFTRRQAMYACTTVQQASKCTLVQQCYKLSETESCKVFTCTKSFQRLSHARCTPVRQAFRLSHATCTPVQQAFRLSHVRYTHVQPAFRLSHARCTPVQQCNKLSEMELCSRCTPVQVFRLSHAPDVHLYNKFSDWVMLRMYTCTISFQRLGHPRRTSVQQCNKLPETESC